MIDFGINKKGRLRSKRTLLKLALEYYEHSKEMLWFGIPDDLLRNEKINIQEKHKLDHLLDSIFGGTYEVKTKDSITLRLYQEIKRRKWMID